jgi:hypothetical protein
MPEQTANVARGPFLFENWKAALQDQELRGCYECSIYSDAWMVGEEKLGPYWFMNTLAHASRGDRMSDTSMPAKLNVAALHPRRVVNYYLHARLRKRGFDPLSA